MVCLGDPWVWMIDAIVGATCLAVVAWAVLDVRRYARVRREAQAQLFQDLNERTNAARDVADESLDEVGWQKERLDRLMRMLEEQGVAQFPGEWGPPMLFAPAPEDLPDPPNVPGVTEAVVPTQPMRPAPPDDTPEV